MQGLAARAPTARGRAASSGPRDSIRYPACPGRSPARETPGPCRRQYGHVGCAPCRTTDVNPFQAGSSRCCPLRLKTGCSRVVRRSVTAVARRLAVRPRRTRWPGGGPGGPASITSPAEGPLRTTFRASWLAHRPPLRHAAKAAIMSGCHSLAWARNHRRTVPCSAMRHPRGGRDTTAKPTRVPLCADMCRRPPGMSGSGPRRPPGEWSC